MEVVLCIIPQFVCSKSGSVICLYWAIKLEYESTNTSEKIPNRA